MCVCEEVCFYRCACPISWPLDGVQHGVTGKISERAELIKRTIANAILLLERERERVRASPNGNVLITTRPAPTPRCRKDVN